MTDDRKRSGTEPPEHVACFLSCTKNSILSSLKVVQEAHRADIDKMSDQEYCSALAAGIATAIQAIDKGGQLSVLITCILKSRQH